MPSRLRIKAAIVAAAAVLAVLAAAGAAQALLVTMPLSTMTREARRVIVADVWSVKAQRVRSADGRGWGTIETMVRLRVRDTLKGSAPRWLTIRVPGGAAEGRTLVVEDAPRFAAGGRYLIFVDDDGSVVDWRRGALRVRGGRVPELNAGLSAAKSAVRAGKDLPRRAASASETPASGTGQALATLFSEDFEGVWPGSWTLGGTPTWGKTSNRKNGGSSSAYCVQSTTPAPGPYGAGVDSYMYAGPFNLSGATQGWLDFDRWLAAGTGDSVSYLISTGGNFWGEGWPGSTGGSFVSHHIDLTNVPIGSGIRGSVMGSPQVWIMFRFVSDASTFAEGAYIDNVKVTKDVATGLEPTISGISPGSASAGTGSQVTITGTNFGAAQGTGNVTFYYNSADRITAPVTSWSATQIVCTVPTGTVNGYAASAGSGPVVVTNNAGDSSAGYPFTVTFSYGGVKWGGTAVPYRINANCGDTTAETTLVDAAWAAWNPASAFTFSRPSTCSTTTLPGANDGNHDIFWSQTTLGSGVLAVNQYWFSGSTLVDSDIAFNDAAFTWGDGSGGTYDIQTVATHELGHSLNLRDLYGSGDSGDIMYGFAAAGQQKRTLSADDAAGVLWIYGARPAMSGSMAVSSSAAYTRSATVTLTSAIVNAAEMRFSNDGAAWSGWEPYAASRAGWALTAGDGAKTVYAQYRDAGGVVYPQSDTIVLDTTPPSTSDNSDGQPHQAFALVLTPTEALSGVAATEYRVDGGSWKAGASLTLRLAIRHKRTGLARGTHTIEYRSTDGAGNVEGVRSCQVILGD